MNRNAWFGVAMGMLAAIFVMRLAVPSLLVDATDLPTDQSSGVADTLADEPQSVGSPSLLVVPAAAFSSDGSDPDGFFFSFDGGYVDGTDTACLKAPAYLPSGATVVAVWASLYNNTTVNVMVHLRRVNVFTGASDVIATLSTESGDTAIQQRGTTAISHPEVDYSEYAYYVTTCLNYANHRLYSVRIHYEYRVYLPMVLRNP